MWQTILGIILVFYAILILPLIAYAGIYGVKRIWNRIVVGNNSNGTTSGNRDKSNGIIQGNSNATNSISPRQSFTNLTTPKRVQVTSASGRTNNSVNNSGSSIGGDPLQSVIRVQPSQKDLLTGIHEETVDQYSSIDVSTQSPLMGSSPTGNSKKPVIVRMDSADSDLGDDDSPSRHTQLLRLTPAGSPKNHAASLLSPTHVVRVSKGSSSASDSDSSASPSRPDSDTDSDDASLRELEEYFTRSDVRDLPRALLQPSHSSTSLLILNSATAAVDSDRPGFSRAPSSELHARGAIGIQVLPSAPPTPDIRERSGLFEAEFNKILPISPSNTNSKRFVSQTRGLNKQPKSLPPFQVVGGPRHL